MSWIVETLLMNRHEIRSNLMQTEPISLGWGTANVVSYEDLEEADKSYSMDFESEEYWNLLTIEKKIKEMFESGLLTEFEIRILDSIAEEKALTDLETVHKLSRQTISKHYSRVCAKIAYALGGEFTDDGYLEYMRRKHNLTNEQVEKMIEHIESKYKHRIRRK